MATRLARRLATTGIAVAAAVVLGAGPASAHFCFKTNLNERAAQGIEHAAAHLLAGGDEELGADRPDFCFDEHAGERAQRHEQRALAVKADHLRVQRALQAQGHRHVVGVAAGLELVEEPEALLRVGKRHRPGAEQRSQAGCVGGRPMAAGPVDGEGEGGQAGRFDEG